MNSIKRAILAELKGVGATLIRTNKHEVWKLPTGAIVTVSVSPSDVRALMEVKQDIRKGLSCPNNPNNNRRKNGK